jgi:small-conductance mechanosensitive channel
LAGAFILHALFFTLVERLLPRRLEPLRQALVRRVKAPARWIAALLALSIVTPFVPSPAIAALSLRHVSAIAAIAAAGLATGTAIFFLEDLLTLHYRLDEADNLKARQVRTRSQILRRIGTSVIALITLSFILMTFPEIRTVGVSLFASAGIAGVVAGLAARPLLSNLIAGLQIALTEPIRIDDTVIVEGEFGWVEEIHATFVVVRTWDLRRLMLPLSYFIEKPFQNWSHRGTELLVPVILSVDHIAPIDQLRQELTRLLEGTPLWDGKVNVLQVTGVKETSVEIRALASAANSGNQWDLACLIREGLLAFLCKHHPQSLPRGRRPWAESVGPGPSNVEAAPAHE